MSATAKTWSGSNGKPGISEFVCFESDPAVEKKNNAPLESKNSPVPVSLAPKREATLGLELFAGKVAHRGKLVDAETLQQYLKNSVEESKLHSLESPVDRLLRLKAQVAQLQDTVKQLADSKVSMAELSKTAREADAQLSERLSDSWAFFNYNTPATNTARTPDRADAVTNAAWQALTSSGLKYEVYGRDHSKDRVDLMAAHVDTLAQAVGTAPAEGAHACLADLVGQLSLLQDARLDSLSRRIQNALREAVVIEPARPGVQSEDTEEKITKLENLMKSCSPDSISSVIAKLQAQGVEHQRAAEILLRVRRLQRESAAVQEMLAADQAGMAALAGSMDSNLAVMKANVAALKERMQKLT